jgi:patatin-related protein
MSQSPPTVTAAQTPPEVEYTQEVRFAVVMYGGSSLAIYMNGVAQELLRLVRATAPERPAAGGVPEVAYLSDEELAGSEHVYRKLGRMLVRGDEESAAVRERRAQEGGALRTRFVVDVLTGTSAGGINAVYLAKALANDQNLKKLMELWVTKGDIGVLLNVPGSTRISVDEDGRRRERELGFEGQPASPLNSSRMYWELLDALRGMDKQGVANGGRRPLYAEEIDLYVTATDTRGRVMNMRLADKVVQELRHRNVFHFRYSYNEGEEANDFKPEYNRFLAFAARCTSAHQAAFEVMNLERGDTLIEKVKGESPAELKHSDAGLRKFYEDYLLAGGNVRLLKTENGKPVLKDGLPVTLSPEEVKALAEAGKLRDELAGDFHGRYFNDGGTLDNSPFSFVADVLPFRQTLHPVDRKLLYVEPAPEHPDEADPGNERWNFLKNAFAGLSSLPSHQTIVEDLTRIQERNNLVERVNHILADLREDIGARNRVVHNGRWPPKHGLDDLRRMRLSDLIRENGVSWGGYQRLRIAQVTNDLTLLIARAAGLDEESDEFRAVRYLVRYWRLTRYEDHAEAQVAAGHVPKVPEINFLLDFDLSWTIRRVQFVLRTIDELDCLDRAARRIAEVTEQEGQQPAWPREDDEAGKREFRTELHRVRGEINRVYARLRDARRALWARRDDAATPNPFRDEVDALQVPKVELLKLLHLPNEQARQTEIEKYLRTGEHAAEHARAFTTLTDAVRHSFKDEILASSRDCEKALGHSGAGLGLKESVRYILSFYYRYFEDFDQVSFPIFYSTDVGEETDPIEVFRVSPEDACLLVDEKKENAGRGDKEDRIDKLAGTTLGHFGAFFDERYRVNDILWGRLDGAERIISALLPGEANEAQRESLVREAHNEIVREAWDSVLKGLGDHALLHDVREALERAPDAARRREIDGGLKDLGVGALWRRYLQLRAVTPGRDERDDFRQAFLDSYEDERSYPLGRKLTMGLKGARVLLKILRSNLKESSRGKGPVWQLITGTLLLFGGWVAFWVGVVKLIGLLLRGLFLPVRKLIERVNAGSRS